MSEQDYEVTFAPLLLVVRGHRKNCECRFDDCAVEVKPAGTINVTPDGVAIGEKWVMYAGPDNSVFGPEIHSDLPPGKYVLIPLEANDE